MIKKILILVTFLAALFSFSCASAPEGYDDAKAAALEAQVKAQDADADNQVPSRYGEGESALSMAEEKEAAGDLEGAMSAYQQAEVKFNVAVAETEKKKKVDSYMEELDPVLTDLDERINALD